MPSTSIAQFARLAGWVCLLVGLIVPNSHAQTAADGYVVDLSDGSGVTQVSRIAILPDGKVLVAGNFDTINGEARPNIARLMPNGRVDLSFDAGAGPDQAVNDFVLLPDGGIVIAGNFSFVDGVSRRQIARLDSNGSVDGTFVPDSGLTTGGSIVALSRQSTGRLLIATAAFPRLEALTPVGMLDSTFNQPNVSNNASQFVNAIAVDASDRILLGGSFTSIGGTTRNRIGRLLANGDLDTSFDVGTGANNSVFSVLPDIDDTIYIGGGFFSINGNPRRFVARLLDDGSLDATYIPDLDAQSGRVFSLALQPDGQLLIGGDFTDFTAGVNRLARLDVNAQIDPRIQPPAGQFGNVEAIAAQADGQILFGANQLLRLNITGELDVDFDPQNGANAAVEAVSWQTPADYLIGGNFTDYNGTARNRIARLSSSGLLDSNFLVGNGADDLVRQLTIGLDQRVLVGGDFTQFDLQPRGSLARLSANGPLDDTFVPDFASTGGITDSVALPDGKFMVVGTFTQVDGVSRNRIARLNADGTLDLTFDPGSGANDAIHAIALTSDGRYWIGGDFTSFNGQPRGRVTRLFNSGALDSTVSSATVVDNTVLAIALQLDEEVLIGGHFQDINGIPLRGIARLSRSGLPVQNFDTEIGALVVNSIQPQANGKILIGGSFSTAQGQPIDRITRLNEDGSLDPDFDNGFGATFANGDDASVNEVALLPNGKVLVGGDFDLLGGLPRTRLGRVLLPEAAQQTLTLDFDTVRWTPGGSMPVPSSVVFSTSNDGINFTPQLAGVVRLVDGVWQQDRFAVDAGLAWIRVTAKFDPHGGTSFTRRVEADPLINILTGDSYDFGTVKTGEVARALLQVRNDGDARLEITGIPGLNAPFIFSAISSCGDLPITIGPARACALGFDFLPTAAGPFSQTFQIVSNSADAPTTFTLTGAGVDPQLTITPDPVNFGNQALGTTSPTQTIVLSNHGEVDLELFSVSAVDSPFGISSDNCQPFPTTLTPGTNCQLELFFQPEQTGPVNGQITIVSDAPDSPANLTLTGNGTQALLDIQPGELPFGDHPANTTSSQLISVLTNTGDADLEVTAITGVAAPFVLSANTCGDPPFTLTPATGCGVGFQFAPISEGLAQANLVIDSNAPSSPDGLVLTGTGLIAEIAVDPTRIDFGEQALGMTGAARIVTVTSTGLADLLIDSIALVGPEAADFALDTADDQCTGAQLPTGSTCTFTLQFTPSDSGIRRAEITISSNAMNGAGRVELLGTNDVVFFDGFEEPQ